MTRANRSRRAGRLILAALLIFLLALAITLLSLMLYLSSNSFRQKAIQLAEQQLAVRINIEQWHFRPLSGFEIRGLEINTVDSLSQRNPAWPVESASIRRATLKYRISPFKREIEIHQAIFDSSHLVLTISPDSASSDSVPAQTRQQTRADSALGLPVGFSLELFAFNHGSFEVMLDSMRIELDDLSLRITELVWPRGKAAPRGGKLVLRLERSGLRLRNDLLAAEAVLDALWAAELAGRELALRSEWNLEPSDLVLNGQMLNGSLPVLDLRFSASMPLDSESVTVDAVQLNVDGQPWLRSRLEYNPARLRLLDTQCRLPVSQLLEIARVFVPDSIGPVIYLHNQDANLLLSSPEIEVRLPRGPVKFQTDLALSDFGTTLDYGRAELEDLDLNFSLDGVWNTGEGRDLLHADIKAGYDSLVYAFGDTLTFFTGAGQISAGAALDRQLTPVAATCSLTVNNLLNGELFAALAMERGRDGRTLFGNGAMKMTDLQLDTGTYNTRADLDIGVSFESLDSLALDLNLTTDPILWQGEDPESIPGLQLRTHVDAALDLRRRRYRFSVPFLQLNDLARVRARGFWEPDRYRLMVPELLFDFAVALNWMPTTLRDPLRDLSVEGQTRLRLDAGKSRGSPLRAEVRLTTENTHLHYPSRDLAVHGLSVDALANFEQPGRAGLQLEIKTDSVRTSSFRESVFRGNRIRLNIESRDLNSLEISAGEIELPDLAARARFDALLEYQKADAELTFFQDVNDSLRLTPDLILRGKTEVSAHLRADSTRAGVQAQIRTRGLDLRLPGGTKLEGVQADLNINQAVDLIDSFLIGRPSPLYTPSESMIEFWLQRPFHHGSLPEMSRLAVASIEAGGYQIDDLKADLYLGDNVVEIPFLLCRLYGGNLGGGLFIDLAGGLLQNATYRSALHFSGINSSLLLPQTLVEREKSIINGNLHVHGTGLDPRAEMDMEGFFNITEIQPRVADNFLRSLDPQDADPGNRATRRLINSGFKPALLSFTIRHGYFYPTISFSQPWYFPLRLSGGQLELARLPMAFFIKTALQGAAKRSTTR